jgi:hypothetical protein
MLSFFLILFLGKVNLVVKKIRVKLISGDRPGLSNLKTPFAVTGCLHARLSAGKIQYAGSGRTVQNLNPTD